MDPEARPKSNPGRGSLLFAVGLLTGGLGAFGVVHWMSSNPLPATSSVVLDIGDGIWHRAEGVLAAAAVLSRDHAVEIKFSTEGGAAGSVSTFPRNRAMNLPGDLIALELWNSEMAFGLDGEVVSFDSFQERMENFAERMETVARAARQAQAPPVLVLHFADEASATHLISTLSVLHQHGIMIVLDPLHYDWHFKPPIAKPTPPQIEPQRHPVEFP